MQKTSGRSFAAIIALRRFCESPESGIMTRSMEMPVFSRMYWATASSMMPFSM